MRASLIGRGLAYLAMACYIIFLGFPLLWLLSTSFKTPQELATISPSLLPKSFRLDNFTKALQAQNLLTAGRNSLVVAVCATVLVTVVAIPAAYALARFRTRLRGAALGWILVSQVFPVILIVIPLFLILKQFGLINTLPGLILTYVAFALPFTVFFLHSFFKSLPHDVYEAAVNDGANEWRAFFSVMLPMAGPGMASVAIFNFLGLWNQFLLPVALNTNQDNYVLTQGMASFASQAGYSVDFGALFAAVVMTVLPVLVVYLIFQRRLSGSVARGTFR